MPRSSHPYLGRRCRGLPAGKYAHRCPLGQGYPLAIMTLLDLGDGLLIRRATPADTEALVAFNADVHRRSPADPPDEGIGAWTRDLMERPHPTFRIDDFLVVEDRRSGAIVSSMNLISQTWSYGGIPFGVGRVELVGTHPDYRRRGLVRRQFEIVHRWSEERGELVQAITGIPWYYRQFGYEYALALSTNRAINVDHVPALGDAQTPGFRVRPATAADIPFVARLDEQVRDRSLVTCLRDEALWRNVLDGRSVDSPFHEVLRIVESPGGESAGFLVHGQSLRNGTLWADMFELLPGLSWLAVTPAVLRHLAAVGDDYAADGASGRCQEVGFRLEPGHPVHRVIPDSLSRFELPFACYIRVPDLARFIRHVAPALEARLARSIAAGHTGELLLSFHRDGLGMRFENGRLTAVDPRPTLIFPEASAGFPGLTFLQLLFGYRSLDQLEDAFPDCRARTTQGRAVLNALFPPQPSSVWPVS
jgi:hypothetical protein